MLSANQTIMASLVRTQFIRTIFDDICSSFILAALLIGAINIVVGPPIEVAYVIARNTRCSDGWPCGSNTDWYPLVVGFTSLWIWTYVVSRVNIDTRTCLNKPSVIATGTVGWIGVWFYVILRNFDHIS